MLKIKNKKMKIKIIPISNTINKDNINKVKEKEKVNK